MNINTEKAVEYLVVDTTAFIQNASLQDVADKMITCPEVIAEITNKRQLRRLVVLPYDLIVKEAFPENVQIITEFAKKTGDYPSLSATDLKVMALTYQLEKEKVGTDHLRSEPIMQKPIVTTKKPRMRTNADMCGFYKPGKNKNVVVDEENTETDNGTSGKVVIKSEDTQDRKTDQPDNGNKTDHHCDMDNIEENVESISHNNEEEEDGIDDQEDDEDDIDEKQLTELLKNLEMTENAVDVDSLLESVGEKEDDEENDDMQEKDDEEQASNDDDDDDSGWITPSNVKQAKKQFNSGVTESKKVTVACMTTDYAMQNVLKQMNLNVSSLNGRLIKQLRTFILRCYTCFKTTGIMTKKFCPKCGNSTLKKVAVSLDKDGKMKIHINPKHPLTGRGKRFSLPKIKGGKHPNNPILVEDQPMADNRPSRLAKTKNNPMDKDFIEGFSPFVMRDMTSRSAQLCIRPGQEFKYWMKKNPNESKKKKRK